MNQDQVKALLLKIRDCETDFSVIFTGKKSSVVNGLYKPATREILLHNKNFSDDGELVYTAIHEYAHHLHAERTRFLMGERAHTNEFWSLFHELIEKAEELKLYDNSFDEPEFRDLTARIKSHCLAENGRVMLDFGKLIVEAHELCKKHKVRFEDYIDRALGVPRVTAYSAMKAASYGVETEFGWDAMKLMSGLRDPDKRAQAAEAFQAGKSPETVKAILKTDKPSEDPVERLEKEKARIERTIEHLSERLKEIDKELKRG